MAIDFPNSPATNDTHTVGDKTWIYADGKWSTSTGVSTTNASLLVSGTLNNARLPAVATTITTVGTLGSLAVTNGVTAATFTGALTGNASTATSAATLTTARTLWGQSFNGSAAISGALTGATSVALNGATSGTTTVQASAVAGTTTITLPAATGTVALTDSVMTSSHFIGTTSVALNRSSGALVLTGITSIDGNAATVTTNANLTGDVTSVGNATTLTNAPVIAKVLTGYTSGAGTVAATDSILQAIQKLNGNDATNANLTGDVTSVGNATTLTNAPVIAKVLTGYVSGSGAVAATDSILQAVQKLNGNDALKADLASPTFTGTPTLPTGTIATTQTAADSSTKLATTAFVTTADNLKANLASPTFTGTVTIPSGASISGFALLASPTFTGTPLSTTAAVDTNTTQVATTAYVVGQGYAKLASPTFTGTVTVPTPTNSTDAVTKAYADAITQSLDIKDSVRVASTVNIAVASALTNTSTIDGVVVATGDRVLLKNQTAGAENGIYVVVASGAASRSIDANTSAKVTSGMYVFVSEGTVSADMGYVLTTNDAITLGTTALSFTQFSGAGQITAGTGLSKSGNTLSIDTAVTANLTSAQTLTNKTLTSPVVNTPTGIVKGDVGLGNVDNTSNATERAATATLTNKTLTTPVINGAITGTGQASANTVSTIVMRDASGNFAAGTITAALTGTASGNLVSGGALGTPSSGTLTNCTFPTLNQSTTGSAATLTNTRTLWGQNFNGSANVSGALALSGATSGTITVQASAVAGTNTITLPAATGTVALLGTIALGTDTTGNYMSGVTAGTGISVTHTPSEGSSATIALANTAVTAASYTNASITVDAQGRLTAASSGASAAPIGSVVMWSGTTVNIPAGYAVANGAYLDTTTYAALYAIIGTRYGALSGSTFPLPNFTSNVPLGITGTPTASATKTTSASSAVDVHTHSVNSSLTATGAPNASLSLALTAGNAASHTHSGGVLTAGSVNSSITAPGGANAGIAVNSSFTAGNADTHTHSGGVFTAGNTNTSITVPGAPNAGIAVNSTFSAGNADTHTHAGSVLTAGNASTINASTVGHTHTTSTLEIIFIIRIS